MKLRTLIAIVLVVAAAGLLLFATLPKYRSGQSLERSIPQKEEELRREQVRDQEVQSLRERLAAIDAGSVPLEEMVTETPDIPGILKEMEDIATRSGMVLREISFGGVSREPEFQSGRPARADPASQRRIVGPHSSLTVSMKLSGTYAGFKRVLSELARGRRILHIENADGGEVALNAGAGDVSEFLIGAAAFYLP